MYTKREKEKCIVSYLEGEEQTRLYAQKLAESLGAGSFVALRGGLGAGKTTFAKGVAEGLGVRETVASPTFTLLCVYESGRLPLYHFDVYRISGEAELAEIGFYEYAENGGVCLCEWADNIPWALPPKRLDVFLEYGAEGGRRITVCEIDEAADAAR